MTSQSRKVQIATDYLKISFQKTIEEFKQTVDNKSKAIKMDELGANIFGLQ